MVMRDKKVVVLIILAVLALISLIYGITASPKGRSKNAAAKRQVAITQSQGVAKNVVPTKRLPKRSQFKTWKRNPFIVGQAASTSSELVLNGIIWNKAKPKAMIGDAIIVKGDTIGANKIVDILPDRVILNDGMKDFELKMEK
jgi:fumarate reductase subunit C